MNNATNLLLALALAATSTQAATIIYERRVTVATVAGRNGIYGTRDGVGAGALFGVLSGIGCVGDRVLVADSQDGPGTKLRRITGGSVETLGTVSGTRYLTGDGARHSVILTEGSTALRYDANGVAVGALDFFRGASVRFDFALIPPNSGGMPTTLRLLNLRTGNSSFLAGGILRASIDGTGEEAGIQDVYATAMADGVGYFSEQWDRIRSVTLAGEVRTVVSAGEYTDGPIAEAKASGFEFGAVDAQGNLIFATFRHIRRISNNRIETLAGHPETGGAFDGDGQSARFNQIRGIAVDSSNRLWVADNNCVRLVTFLNSAVSRPPEAGIRLAPGITVRGEVGGMYRIEYREDMNAEWVLLRVVVLAHPEQEYFDFTPEAPKRFYRVVAP